MTIDSDVISSVAAILGVALAAIPLALRATRRGRLRTRMAQTLEMLEKLPKQDDRYADLRSELSRTIDYCVQELAACESAWIVQDKRLAPWRRKKTFIALMLVYLAGVGAIYVLFGDKTTTEPWQFLAPFVAYTAVLAVIGHILPDPPNTGPPKQ
jgi:hypothetical protein